MKEIILNKSCLKSRELFSPWLDEEATPGESLILEEHISQCPYCKRELEEWRNISGSLKLISYEDAVPDGFSGKVLSRLKEGRDKQRPPRPWYRYAAAAAAVLLLTGSAGVINNFVLVPDKKFSVVEVGPPAQNTPMGVDSPAAPTNGPDTLEDPQQSPDTGTPTRPVPEKTSAPLTKNTPSPQAVLLSSEIKIRSTLLKVESANPGAATEKAKALADGAGTVSQATAGQDSGGKSVSVLTITVPESGSSRLIVMLSEAGMIIDRTDEVKDITARYKEALARQQELVTLTGDSLSDKDVLETELASLNKQIKEWQEQADRHTIILWIEKGQD